MLQGTPITVFALRQPDRPIRPEGGIGNGDLIFWVIE